MLILQRPHYLSTYKIDGISWYCLGDGSDSWNKSVINEKVLKSCLDLFAIFTNNLEKNIK